VNNDNERDELKQEAAPGGTDAEAAASAPEEVAVAPEEQATEEADPAALAAQYLEGWQRERAELANFKKRMEREREQWQAAILGDLLLGLLPILDDFDLALASVPDDAEHQEWLNGIILIQRKLRAHLEKLGLEEIEAVGQPFDPVLHEAMTHEASDDHQPDCVIGIVRKGYRLADRVLRPALVRVSS